MSKSAEPDPVTKVVRTVSPGPKGHPNAEMDVIGWAIFLVMAVLFLPFLPVILGIWVVSRLLDFVARQRQ